jgi:erythrocyte band 7 integral membrane protein
LKSTYGRALELLNTTTEATFPITLYIVLENLLLIKSLILVLSYCFSQVVQEYERAVIFRLGRLMAGGAKG